jgi:hypothetical protein
MATVIVNGQRRVQEEFVTLGDLRREFPNCFLIRETDQVEIRRDLSVLGDGTTYILKETQGKQQSICYD